jgi:hypothetical protein
LDYGLCFNGHNLQLQGYTDADWEGDLDDRKSMFGYIFTLAGGAISWCSMKQDSVALSSMEAEYIAAPEAAKEGMWLREFLASVKVVETGKCITTCHYFFVIIWRRSRSPRILNFIVKVNTLREGIIIFEM